MLRRHKSAGTDNYAVNLGAETASCEYLCIVAYSEHGQTQF